MVCFSQIDQRNDSGNKEYFGECNDITFDHQYIWSTYYNGSIKFDSNGNYSVNGPSILRDSNGKAINQILNTKKQSLKKVFESYEDEMTLENQIQTLSEKLQDLQAKFDESKKHKTYTINLTRAVSKVNDEYIEGVLMHEDLSHGFKQVGQKYYLIEEVNLSAKITENQASDQSTTSNNHASGQRAQSQPALHTSSNHASSHSSISSQRAKSQGELPSQKSESSISISSSSHFASTQHDNPHQVTLLDSFLQSSQPCQLFPHNNTNTGEHVVRAKSPLHLPVEQGLQLTLTLDEESETCEEEYASDGNPPGHREPHEFRDRRYS